MRPRAVKFILFHSKCALANRAASEICPCPMPCTGFASRSYVSSVVPAILSPLITLQQFKTLAATWICTAHVPQLGPLRMSAVTFVMSIFSLVKFNQIKRSFLRGEAITPPCLSWFGCYSLLWLVVNRVQRGQSFCMGTFNPVRWGW